MPESAFDFLKSAESIESSSRIEWERCRTVVMVVHGIGEHRANRIAAEARQGFDAYVSAHLSKASEAGWTCANVGDWLRVSASEGDHIIIPYLWSRSERLAKSDFYFDTFSDVFSAISAVFRSLKRIHRTKFLIGILLSLLITGLMLPLWTAALIGCVYLVALIIGVIPLLLHSFYTDFSWGIGFLLHGKWWYIPLLLLFLVRSVIGLIFFLNAPSEGIRQVLQFWSSAFSWLVRVILFPLTFVADLIGDVAEYLDYKERRDEVISEVVAILTELRLRSPNARLVIVGHSLGSVLVTHALASTQSSGTSQWNCLLVTLGSPLVLLNWLYPDQILSPEDLAKRLLSAKTISRWHNAWRRFDYVGRSIFRAPLPMCSESTIGWGGHSNYFGDIRVWITIIQLLQSCSEFEFEQTQTLPHPM